MNKLLIIFFIFLISCQKTKNIDDSFFSNTAEYKIVRCGDYLSQNAWVFKLDSLKKIYSCSNFKGTEFIISDKNLIETYEKLSFPNEKIFPWILTYDNKEIIGVRTFYKNSLKKTDLVSINIQTKSIDKLFDLPDSNYWFSEHPISKSGILVAQYDTRHMFIYDKKNQTFSKIQFETSGSPIISRNGAEILYVDGESVYLYDIFRETTKELYSSKKNSDYSAFKAYFGADDKVIIKGIKHPDIKPLQKVLFKQLDISSKKTLNIGDIDFKNGYRYKN